MSVALAKMARFIKGLIQSASSRYEKLGLVGKAVIWFILFFYVCLATFIIVVTPARIAQFTYDAAQYIRHLPYGYTIIIVVMIVASFPPFIGHVTLLNLFGFTYGIRGFFPAAFGTLAGSAIAFVTLRFMFSKRLRSWTSTNEKWQALEAVIRSRGMPLIILIRMSSFPPWAWSNSLFASITPVSLFQFFIATCFVLPKVLVYVFVGSRIARLSDGEQRNHMDTQTKIINSLLVAGGVLISVVASSLVYYLMQNEIKRLHDSPSERDELAAEALEAAEEAPLLGSNFLGSP
ncbi:Golgi apparatus membrane protein TVP38 [Suillus clintonianus]|uniref:Golgi apparatus membrane protein TVP38 n=1 Tax=Suillus clintonianus TaxID=1904413 RepID=UPI001B8738BF|nr:Golgi apparatus membrane protein TVP38 [Suillus clintonianus]KAG2146731.1 Golgi apparatus membrane protein TVP38 [Suillus clintonianus]